MAIATEINSSPFNNSDTETIKALDDLLIMATRSGFTRLDSLLEALMSVEPGRDKGVGRYQEKSIAHLQKFQPFAVPNIIVTLSHINHPVRSLEDVQMGLRGIEEKLAYDELRSERVELE